MQLQTLLNTGNFPGLWKEAFAISHCQVSEDPYKFFVIHKKAAKAFAGYEIICNARILESSDPIAFKEACMSFPFRQEINTKRFSKIKVEFEVPGLFNNLETKTLDLEGIQAFIFQHEVDHSKGINIYEKFKK